MNEDTISILMELHKQNKKRKALLFSGLLLLILFLNFTSCTSSQSVNKDKEANSYSSVSPEQNFTNSSFSGNDSLLFLSGTFSKEILKITWENRDTGVMFIHKCYAINDPVPGVRMLIRFQRADSTGKITGYFYPARNYFKNENCRFELKSHGTDSLLLDLPFLLRDYQTLKSNELLCVDINYEYYLSGNSINRKGRVYFNNKN